MAGSAGFFGGMKYQDSRAPKIGQFRLGNGNTNQAGGMMNRGGGVRFGSGYLPINGEITAVDDKSLTVKLPDGGSKIVILSDNLKINKTTEAVRSELTTGITITAFGKTNSDGSVTAESLQLNSRIQRQPIDQPGVTPDGEN